MKRLVGLLMLLFITTGVFGQKFIRSHSFIESTPTGNNTIEDWIRDDGDNGDYKWIPYVHFINKGRLYLLSYEPKEDRLFGGYRDIYLYSKDINDINSPWEKASNAVMRNHWKSGDDHDEVDFFIYDKDKHNSSVGKVVVKNEYVEITIGWELWVGGRLLISEPITIKFKPIGNNMYSHSKGKVI